MSAIESDLKEILDEMHRLAVPNRLQGMQRFGIDTSHALGVQIPELRRLSRQYAKGRAAHERHQLAAALWETGIHEARILASMVDAAELVDSEQLEAWIAAVCSWDLCDQCCNNLFRHTPLAWDKALQWSALAPEGPEFTVRAGFVLMATLCVKEKHLSDEAFAPFWPLLLAGCTDGRNNVKKGLNWALRQLGKRNTAMHARAVETARKMLELDAAPARWIARDALRELESEKVLARLGLG